MNPSHAIETAKRTPMKWADNLNEEIIYQQLSSAEFRLYEEINIYL